MTDTQIEVYCPSSRSDWRQWLSDNHKTSSSIWLICHKKSSGLPTVHWSEAVDEALCFGWIDSTKRKLNDTSYMQLYTKRKPNSTWSKINKEKVKILIQNNQMTPAGMACIEKAQANGSWTILDEVEDLIIPKELEDAFEQNSDSKTYYTSLSKSIKKMILYKIYSAKRPSTRQKRIDDIILHLSLNQIPT